MKRIISPSMLSADFGFLNRDTQMIERSAAEWVHIDVMDGVFVPNISYGFPILNAITKATTKFIDVHLMIIEPEKYVARFAEAGASLVTFHYEATEDVAKTIELTRNSGAQVGISIKPATPVEVLYPWLDKVDLVLVMSVEPGFGGQSFIEGSWQKIKDLRVEITRRGLSTLIEVDGGVGVENSRQLFDAGCDVLVAGTSIFRAEHPEQEILKMLVQ